MAIPTQEPCRRLSLDRSIDSLVALYVPGVCGLGYGLRQIVEVLIASGIGVDTVVVSGGAGNAALVRQLLADSTGIAIATVETPEPVLLGAVASSAFPDFRSVVMAMTVLGEKLPQT